MKQDIVWKSYVGPIDIKEVEIFEEKIGYKFPKSYKKIVSQYNGACVSNHLTSFNFHSNLTNKNESYGLGGMLEHGQNSGSTETMEWEWSHKDRGEDFPFPKNIVPFAIDGGGNSICFDYRDDISTDEPEIVVWHHEAISGSIQELSYVANSFDEFLDMLHDGRSEEMKKRFEEAMKYSILD